MPDRSQITEIFTKKLIEAIKEDPITYGKFDVLTVSLFMTPDELPLMTPDYEELIQKMLTGCLVAMMTVRYRHSAMVDEIGEGRDILVLAEKEASDENVADEERVNEIRENSEIEVDMVTELDRHLMPKVIGVAGKTLGPLLNNGKISVAVMLGNFMRNFALLYIFVCPHDGFIPLNNGNAPVHVNGV